MSASAQVLADLGVPYELTIASAHRTPQRLFDYIRRIEERGLEVIIAGAGGAAHLPGVVASLTTLPVIGVPIKSPTLNGVDSLYSIVQMPSGVPVATVAINGAKNAGLLAVQILGVKERRWREKFSAYKAALAADVEEKAARLEKLGYEAYQATKSEGR